MKKVYTLSDLAEETGITTNGFQAFLKDGTVIGLFNDTFSVKEIGRQTFHLSPSEIISYVLSCTSTTFSLTDSQFYDLCKESFRLNDEAENEFFELDLDVEDPEKVLNNWLTQKKIPYTVLSCKYISDDIFELDVTK